MSLKSTPLPTQPGECSTTQTFAATSGTQRPGRLAWLASHLTIFAIQQPRWVPTSGSAGSKALAHLRAEELRRQAAAEDAVARRLFNGMTPTVCPRCSTDVPAERYAAESTAHECSLCASSTSSPAKLRRATPPHQLRMSTP